MAPKPARPTRPTAADNAENQVPAEMPPKTGSHRSDAAIRARASHRHGIVTLGDLREIGLSERAVRDRAAGGRLRRLHRGVYATDSPTAESRWMAAVLAVGPDAVLSHRSAAALWDLAPDRRTVDVSIPAGRTRHRPGIRIHTATLADSDVTERLGIRCSALPRTLMDIAAVVDREALGRAIDRAEQLRVFDLAAVEALIRRSRGSRGVGALRAVLDGYAVPAVTRSEVERRMLAAVRRAGLAEPRVNAWIPLAGGGGYEADFLWTEAGLVVEVDGRAHHATRRAFEHDRRRDRRLALAGFETRRYAAAEVLREPARVADEVRAFLEARLAAAG